MAVKHAENTKMDTKRRSGNANSRTRAAQMMRTHPVVLGKGSARLGAVARRKRAPAGRQRVFESTICAMANARKKISKFDGQNDAIFRGRIENGIL